MGVIAFIFNIIVNIVKNKNMFVGSQQKWFKMARCFTRRSFRVLHYITYINKIFTIYVLYLRKAILPLNIKHNLQDYHLSEENMLTENFDERRFEDILKCMLLI